MERSDIKRFRDIPNVGVATEKLFVTLGMDEPTELKGKDPYQMYSDLCRISQKIHDPCMIDIFISAVRFMEGGPPRKWWEFTGERKRHLGAHQ
jgi:hypothetical protein